MGQGRSMKLDFAKSRIDDCLRENPHVLSFGDIFTFPNVTCHYNRTRYQLVVQKTMLENIGYWQNESEVEKR